MSLFVLNGKGILVDGGIFEVLCGVSLVVNESFGSVLHPSKCFVLYDVKFTNVCFVGKEEGGGCVGEVRMDECFV